MCLVIVISRVREIEKSDPSGISAILSARGAYSLSKNFDVWDKKYCILVFNCFVTK